MKTLLIHRVRMLVHSMTEAEKAIFRVVTNATKNTKSENGKIVELFERMQDPHPPDADLLKNDKNRKLLELLENRILDNLLNDINLLRTPDMGQGINHAIGLYKDFLKANLLQARGITYRAFRCAEKLKKKAIAAENYALAISSMQLQLSLTPFHKDSGLFRKRLKEIDDLEHRRLAKQKAIRLYHDFRMRKFYRFDENLDTYIEESLETLYACSGRLNSPAIDFITNFFEKERAESANDWEGAWEICIRLRKDYKLISDSSILFNLYELVYEQGKILFYRGRKSEALSLLKLSLENLPAESFSSQKARQLLFIYYYSRGSYAEAEEVLRPFLKSDHFLYNLSDELKSVWIYYRACLYFAINAREKAQKNLTDAYRMNHSRESFNLKIRFLKILCYIDSENLDNADKAIEALRKYIERRKLTEYLNRTGLQVVYNVFLQLRLVGYDFHRLFDQWPGLRKDCSLSAKKLKALSLQDFVIRYDQWLYFKTRGYRRVKIRNTGPSIPSQL